MNLSTEIEAVLKFFTDSKKIYEQATDDQSYYDKLEQDLLHQLEIDDLSYHEVARVGLELRESREQRRNAKNTIEIYKTLYDLVGDGQFTHVVNRLKGIMGNVKNREVLVTKRKYTNKVKGSGGE